MVEFRQAVIEDAEVLVSIYDAAFYAKEFLRVCLLSRIMDGNVEVVTFYMNRARK